MRKHALFNACLMLVSALLLTTGSASAQEGIVCAECHEEMAATFLHSFHARMWEGQDRTSANVCETCHGPADRHLENPSRETIISFGPESAQTPEEQSRVCLGCHGDNTHLAMWDMGQHKNHGVACVSCHSVHVADSEVNQPVICFTCHRHTRLQANKTSHHPVIEGKVSCTDCHNTHGTLTHAMIKEDDVNQLCYQCHAEKRGPFLWEHPPVEENCVICHEPHGSRHENLMVEKIPNLCQDCHDFSRHPGTPYDLNTSFSGERPSNRFFARACLNCHSMIHGSVAPENPSNGLNSGRFFTR